MVALSKTMDRAFVLCRGSHCAERQIYWPKRMPDCPNDSTRNRGGRERSRSYNKTDFTFERCSFQRNTQHLWIQWLITPAINQQRLFERRLFVLSSFVQRQCCEALNKILTYYCEFRQLLSLGFVGLCMGGLLFPLPPPLPRSPSSVLALFGSAHCCVACGVKQQVHQSHPEARPRTVREDCCVIGLAFERHVA